VLLVIAALAVLVAGGYAAAYLSAGEKVPRGTSVVGVNIGARTEADAAATLRDALAARTARPIAITAGEVTQDVAAAAAACAPSGSGTTSPVAAS